MPDLYQGHELIELSLVDPDNRRPVDHGLRRELLHQMRDGAASGQAAAIWRSLQARVHDGRAKMWVSWRALQLRKAHEPLFAAGEYLPLVVSGSRAAHAVACGHRHGEQCVVVVVGRLFASMGLAVGTPPIGDAWGDTRVELPQALEGFAWVDALSDVRRVSRDGVLMLAEVFADAPVAVLAAER